MDVKLVVVGGDAKTKEIVLRLPAVIGRGRGCTVVLPHPLVSRRHCTIFESQGQLMVRDMGSLNGTFVNNSRITEAVLPPGELLTVGTVTFRAVYRPASGISPMVPPNLPATVDPMAPVVSPLHEQETEFAPESAPVPGEEDFVMEVEEVEMLPTNGEAGQDDDDGLAKFLRNLK
jgi:hypothetical protein